MNEEAVRSRELVKSSLLGMESRQTSPNVGASSLATAERYMLLQRLIEKHRMNQSSCLSFTSIGGVKFDARLPDAVTTDQLLPRNPNLYGMNAIDAHRVGHGQQLSCAEPNVCNASLVSKLAPNVSEKTSFPLPRVKTVPFKKPQLHSFRKAWSQLDQCPHMRKEVFSRRLYENRHKIQGSTRSVIRQSLHGEKEPHNSNHISSFVCEV